MHKWISFRSGQLIALLLLASSLAVQAQQPDPTAGAQDYAQPAATAASFSDIELKSFVQARQSVDAIRAEISAQLQNTQDPQETQKLQEEANVKMVATVEAAGLSREKYNEIAQAVMNDPALAQKISQIQ
ncbi:MULTISPECIES: DUF4168 domain-containing protein [unclassified Microbulbifer]|uniref:DUF4168 domain-containing protein n=1 Tax=unclassified Microbulbifer TaxID=2619833 RepID=UPI0027E4ECA2|nr:MULTISPECIES: DUF4168 domain-containing protein [unclassified Microbulbifer]